MVRGPYGSGRLYVDILLGGTEDAYRTLGKIGGVDYCTRTQRTRYGMRWALPMRACAKLVTERSSFTADEPI